DDNIAHSTRSTDFMTPKSHASRLFRDAVLSLAQQFPFARALVNSGRLSVPTVLQGSPLNTPDADAFEGWMLPGAPADDVELRSGTWLLSLLSPASFNLLLFFDASDADALACWQPAIEALADDRDGAATVLVPCTGLVAQRYDARPGTCYLLRPDQHVCARWRAFDRRAVEAAIARATCNE
ncbi:MAG: FAD-dependent oxidoreductase, partial [Casimicrobiaceae bacterium]